MKTNMIEDKYIKANVMKLESIESRNGEIKVGMLLGPLQVEFLIDSIGLFAVQAWAAARGYEVKLKEVQK